MRCLDPEEMLMYNTDDKLTCWELYLPSVYIPNISFFTPQLDIVDNANFRFQDLRQVQVLRGDVS